jgi:hypothetical protein
MCYVIYVLFSFQQQSIGGTVAAATAAAAPPSHVVRAKRGMCGGWSTHFHLQLGVSFEIGRLLLMFWNLLRTCNISEMPSPESHNPRNDYIVPVK